MRSFTVFAFLAAVAVKNSSNQRSQNHSAFTKENEQMKCTHCGFLGHTMDRCYKVHSYSSEYRTEVKFICEF